MKHLTQAFLLCFIVIYTQAQDTFTGNVIAVLDGNTLQVTDHYNDTLTLKLDGFESPELNQAFGEEAKSFTASKCLHQSANIVLLGKDRFGNDKAEVILEDDQNLGEALLHAGLAWYHVKGQADNNLTKIHHENKINKIGLWTQESPLEPWIYRRQQTMTKPKLSY